MVTRVSRWPLSALNRKLVRDLWHVRGQVLAIAAVIGAGIALYVATLSTFDSLDLTLRTYYDRYRFGDVFVSLERAPLAVADELAEIPGVTRVDTRVVVDVTLDVPGLDEPAAGRLISFPAGGRPALCDLFLREGRLPEPGRSDEVVASEGFARAHGLHPGDRIRAVINGRLRALAIVGLALSPEFIYPIRPGEILPDEKRFGVFWMDRRALATAFSLDGAFNDAVLALMRGASEADVLARVDRLLESGYGGLGAVPRALQASHWYLANELLQLRNSGAYVPAIFLGVAAFLLNVVLSRLVLVQRPQVAALKALGYTNREVAWHYVKGSVAIAALGAVIGVGAGAWLGWATTQLYTRFFHFPILLYRLQPAVVAQAVALGLLAAALGGLGAVRRAARMAPAEALRPEVPARYRVSLAERAGLGGFLTQPARMIARALQRHPGRAALSVLGIGLATALMVVGTFTLDSMDLMMDVQFNVAQRFDVMATFVRPASAGALDDIRRLPGVMAAEPFRAVPVRLRFAHRSRHTAITGVPPGARLSRIVDSPARVVALPGGGLVLSAMLARVLGARPGDDVTVEVLEGPRRDVRMRLAAVVDEYLGMNAYLELDALHALMREGGTLSGAYLQVDPARAGELYDALKATPRVAGVLLKDAAFASFNETMASMMRQMLAVYIVFAGVIAFGVVYNNARISLAERSRELATLRVIGFSRGEVSYVLLGEIAVLTLVALPVGCLMGYAMAAGMMSMLETELWRLPFVILPRTYAFAVITSVGATLVSALIVRARLDRLDLVAVLKIRE
jgi:putative ABC transport system permease protein